MKRAYVEQSIAHMRDNRGNLFAGVITTAVALLILGSFALVYLNLIHLSGIFFDRSHYAVFVSPKAPYKSREQILKILKKNPLIGEIEELDPEQAKAKLIEGFGEAKEVLKLVPFSNLPHLIEFSLKDARTLSEEELERLKAIEGVEEIFLGRETKDQIDNFFAISNFIGIALIVMLLLSIAIIIRNAILLAVRIRFQEIEILKTLGATGTYIRFPFIVEAGVTLFLGFLVSHLGLYVLYQFLLAGVTFNESTYVIAELARFFSPLEMFLEFALLLMVGLGSSFYATSQVLRELKFT